MDAKISFIEHQNYKLGDLIKWHLCGSISFENSNFVLPKNVPKFELASKNDLVVVPTFYCHYQNKRKPRIAPKVLICLWCKCFRLYILFWSFEIASCLSLIPWPQASTVNWIHTKLYNNREKVGNENEQNANVVKFSPANEKCC